MTTHLPRETAKIYAFPPRGRIRADGHRAAIRTSIEAEAQRFARVAFGSGGYHEAAIREAAEQARDT